MAAVAAEVGAGLVQIALAAVLLYAVPENCAVAGVYCLQSPPGLLDFACWESSLDPLHSSLRTVPSFSRWERSCHQKFVSLALHWLARLPTVGMMSSREQ